MELRLADGTVLSGTVEEMQEYLHQSKQEHSLPSSSFSLNSYVCDGKGWRETNNAYPSYPAETAEQAVLRSWQQTSIYPFYTSRTHGHMLIRDMHTLHIKNAILKMHREDTHLDRPREFEGLVETLASRLTQYEKEKEESVS